MPARPAFLLGMRPWLRRTRGFVLGAVFFFGQTDAAVRILVNFPALLHFPGELYERPASGVTQVERRCDFAKAQRLARTRQMRDNLGFGNRFTGFAWAWHESAIVCAGQTKREGLPKKLGPTLHFDGNSLFSPYVRQQMTLETFVAGAPHWKKMIIMTFR